MANHPSAEKRARQAVKRRQRARVYKGKVRSKIKLINKLLEDGEVEKAKVEFRGLESSAARAASRGYLKRKTASRIVSKMMRKINKLAIEAGQNGAESQPQAQTT